MLSPPRDTYERGLRGSGGRRASGTRPMTVLCGREVDDLLEKGWLAVPISGQEMNAIGSENEMCGVDPGRIVLVEVGGIHLRLVISDFHGNVGRFCFPISTGKLRIQTLKSGCPPEVRPAFRLNGVGARYFLGSDELLGNIKIRRALQKRDYNSHLHIRFVFQDYPAVVYVHPKRVHQMALERRFAHKWAFRDSGGSASAG